jgi:hypothetical protein
MRVLAAFRDPQIAYVAANAKDKLMRPVLC